MKIWKQLTAGLLGLTLAASLAGAAFAAEPPAPKELPAAKPAGPFSQCLVLEEKMQNATPIPPSFSARNPAKRIRAESEEIPTIAQFSAKPETERRREFLSWFPELGTDPQAPEASEAVLARMGTVIGQSKTVNGDTVTLNGAVWDGDTLRLSLVVNGKNLPKELTKDSHIYTEECSLELPEKQRADYLRAELSQRIDAASEDLEEQVQRYLEMKPSYFHLGFTQPEREGNTLTWEAVLPLKSFLDQPSLTLHLENIALYEKVEKPEEQTVAWRDGKRTGPKPDISVLKGPFDFTFTLEKSVLPLTYTGDADVTCEGIPLRFTRLEIGAFEMNVDYVVQAPVNPIQVTRPEGAPPAPEPDPNKLDSASVTKVLHKVVQGLWTKDGKYVDCSQRGGGMSLVTSQDGSEANGSVGGGYPYPIDPAAVTAVNLGGTRVELSGLKPAAK